MCVDAGEVIPDEQCWLQLAGTRPVSAPLSSLCSSELLSGVLGSCANALAGKRGAAVKVCLPWGVFPFPCWSCLGSPFPARCSCCGVQNPPCALPQQHLGSFDVMLSTVRNSPLFFQLLHPLCFVTVSMCHQVLCATWFRVPPGFVCHQFHVPPGLMCHQVSCATRFLLCHRVPCVLSRD